LERGTLRVGTTGDFNPMSFKDTSTNSLVGYDIDAMNQLATDMGVKVEFVTTEWATLVNGIVSDRYDVFAGGSSLNMARAKTVAFTSPYVYAGTVPLINKKRCQKVSHLGEHQQQQCQRGGLDGYRVRATSQVDFPQGQSSQR